MPFPKSYDLFRSRITSYGLLTPLRAVMRGAACAPSCYRPPIYDTVQVNRPYCVRLPCVPPVSHTIDYVQCLRSKRVVERKRSRKSNSFTLATRRLDLTSADISEPSQAISASASLTQPAWGSLCLHTSELFAERGSDRVRWTRIGSRGCGFAGHLGCRHRHPQFAPAIG